MKSRAGRVGVIAGTMVLLGMAGCGGDTVTTAPVTSTPTPSTGQARYIYVVQPSTGGAGTVLEFNGTANGSSSPLLTLTPSSNNPTTVFADITDQVWVGGIPGGPVINTGAVQAYASNASGGYTLARTLTGTASAGSFMSAQAVWVDSGGLVYVLGSTDSISVYATGTATTPYRFIQGSATGLTNPVGLVVDGQGNIYVANNDANSPSILVFNATAAGNAAPSQVVTLQAAAGGALAAIGIDAAGELYAAIGTPGGAGSSILVFTLGAQGGTVPVRTISGTSTGLAYAAAISVDGAGYTYVLNETTAGGVTTPNMLVFAPGASGNVSPARQFTSNAWTAASGQIGLY